MFLAIQASACNISIGEIARKRIKKTASATWSVAQEKSKSEKHPRRPCFASVCKSSEKEHLNSQELSSDVNWR